MARFVVSPCAPLTPRGRSGPFRCAHTDLTTKCCIVKFGGRGGNHDAPVPKDLASLIEIIFILPAHASKPFWPRFRAKAVRVQTPRVQVARLRQPLGETLPPLFRKPLWGEAKETPRLHSSLLHGLGVCGLNGLLIVSQRASVRAPRALDGLSTGKRPGSTGRPAFKDPPSPPRPRPPPRLRPHSL